MGSSLPPPSTIDLVGSFSRLDGSEVEVVLSGPAEHLRQETTVTFAKGAQRVPGQASWSDQSERGELTLRAPRDHFNNGSWGILLGEQRVRIGARLLIQGERPTVLLWGAKSSPSRLADPNPERLARVAAAKARRAAKEQELKRPSRRAASAAGKALDRALAPLPSSSAAKIRSGIRKAARKVL